MFIAYAVITALASLNRETGLLFAGCFALYFADQWRTRGYWVRVIVLAGIWAAITLALHLAYGSAPHVLGLLGTFQHNMDVLTESVFASVILLPLWVLTAVNVRRADKRLQRLLWCAGAYVLTIIVGGTWSEVRLLLTAFPLALPIILRD